MRRLLVMLVTVTALTSAAVPAVAGDAPVQVPSCPKIPMPAMPFGMPPGGGYPTIDIGSIIMQGTQLLAQHAIGCENIKGAYAQAQALLIKQRDSKTLQQLGKWSPSIAASLQKDIDQIASSVGSMDGNVVRDAKYFALFQQKYPDFDPNGDINAEFNKIRIRMWEGTNAALTANSVVTNQNSTVAANVDKMKQLVQNGGGTNELLGALGTIVAQSVEEARTTNQLISSMMAQQARYARDSNQAALSAIELNKAQTQQQVLQDGATNVWATPPPAPQQ